MQEWLKITTFSEPSENDNSDEKKDNDNNNNNDNVLWFITLSVFSGHFPVRAMSSKTSSKSASYRVSARVPRIFFGKPNASWVTTLTCSPTCFSTALATSSAALAGRGPSAMATTATTTTRRKPPVKSNICSVKREIISYQYLIQRVSLLVGDTQNSQRSLSVSAYHL